MKTLILDTGVSHSSFDYALVKSLFERKNAGRIMFIGDIGTALYLPTEKSKKLVGGSPETIANTIDTDYADSITSVIPKNWRYLNTAVDFDFNLIIKLLTDQHVINAVELVPLPYIKLAIKYLSSYFDQITILVYQDPRSFENVEQLAAIFKKGDLNYQFVGLDWNRNTTKTKAFEKQLGKKIQIYLDDPKVKRAWLTENLNELLKIYK